MRKKVRQTVLSVQASLLCLVSCSLASCASTGTPAQRNALRNLEPLALPQTPAQPVEISLAARQLDALIKLQPIQ